MGALLGPFWLNKPLAAGGMGEVWSGVHRDQGVQVAIKFLTRDASDPDFRAAFDAEVAAMAALDHPNVVRIYDYGEVGANASDNLVTRIGAGTPYIVMEQARGTLADREEPLPWPTVHTALRHLLGALAHAHAHDMLHRDLKPGNVLLCPGEREEEPDRIVLTDFGFAGHIGDRDSKVVGLTPSYAAPEQLRWQAREEGPWTDLFALGCLAWRLLTGAPPYHATSIDQALALQARGIPRLDGVDVPPGVHDWLRRALSPYPRGRVPSAADAASALADAVAGEPMTLASLPPRWRDPSAGRRTTHLTGTGLGLFGVRRVRLVGRQREKGHLWAALREARAGQARVVMLRGPSGVGTSRLARWLATRAHEDAGLKTLWGSHNARPTSLDGVDGMLRQALMCDGLAPADLEERIQRWLTERGAAAGGSRSLAVALTGGGSRIGRMTSFRDVLIRIGAGRPTVVVLDDAQFGAEAVDLAMTMTKHPENAPVLLVLTFGEESLRERPELMAKVRAMAARPEVRDLTLGPLNPAERQQLLTQQLGLEDTVAGQVAEVSEGNPAVILALLADWVKESLLVPSPSGGWQLKDVDHIRLPDRLVEPWVERVDRALQGRPDDDGRALEIAAVLGMRVSIAMWASACSRAAQTPKSDLIEAMQRRGLITDANQTGDPGWSFADGRVRAALQRRAQRMGRSSTWHGIIADLLAANDPRRARHLLAAGRQEEALLPLYQGLMRQLPEEPPAGIAARLRRLSDTTTALRLRPTDPRTAWVRHAEGALALARGDLEGAEAAALRLEEQARASGWSKAVSRALALRAELARRHLDLPAAAGFASDALSLATTRSDHLRAVLQLAAVERLRGRMKAASTLLKEGRTMAADRGDSLTEGWMWTEVARLGMAVGRLSDANRALGSARTCFARASSRAGYCAVGEHFGLLALFEGDHRGARQRLASARSAWLQAGQQRAAVRCATRLALVAMASDELEPASRAIRDTLSVSDTVGDRRIEQVARLALAYLLARQHKDDEALRLVREVSGQAEASGWVDPEIAFVAAMGAPDLDPLRPLAHSQLLRLGRRNEATHFAPR